MEISEAVHASRAAMILGLNADDRAERRNFIGASDANIICSGDRDKIYTLWQVKTGQIEAEDLSDVLQVQMGVWTEAFNLAWYERKTGVKVTRRQDKVVHPKHPWLRASLDGVTAHPEHGGEAVIDAKHVGGFQEIEEVLANYTPQLVVGMACTGKPHAVLSVLTGNHKWEWIAIARDPILEAHVINQCATFWKHVQDKTSPPIPDKLLPPVPFEKMRKVSMVTSNAWVSLEADYLANEEAAGKFTKTKDEMKKLVERDVGEARGPKLMIVRNKAGALSFKKV